MLALGGLCASAETPTYRFDIPEQSADRSLTLLARQARTPLLFSFDEVRDVITHAVVGEYALEIALAQLLAGTNLEGGVNGHGVLTVTIRPEDAPVEGGTSMSRESGNRSTAKQRGLLGVLAAVFSVSAGAQEVVDEEDNDAEQSMEEIVVTGTNIRGVSPASPLIQIDKDYIKLTGRGTVADVVRTLPQNFNGGGNFGNINAGLAHADNGGNSKVNLRGLGADATLVLLNGRRLSFGGLESRGVDISSIPLAAVETIDILTDGASAIYGADAVAGVVNIRLAKDFDGTEVRAYFADTTDGGGARRQVGGISGLSWRGGNALVSYEYGDVEEVDASDRDYTEQLAALGPYSLVPERERHSVFGAISQRLGDHVSSSFEGLYAHRTNGSSSSRSSFQAFSDTEIEQYAMAGGLRVGLPAAWEMAFDASISSEVTVFGGYFFLTGIPDRFDMLPLEIANDFLSYQVTLNGTLFEGPAGPVRAAFGGGYLDADYERVESFTGGRSSTNAFVEFRVPLIAPRADGGSPVMESVFAGRYEDFSDFGSSSTPKVGIIYRPSESVTIRGSWGESFRVPGLVQQYGISTLSLNSGQNEGDLPFLLRFGANSELQPEQSESWSLSVDYFPAWLPNLELTASLFRIDYEGRIDIPFFPFTVAISDPDTYAEFFTYDPSLDLVNEVLSSATVFTNRTPDPFDPENVDFILDSRQQNIGRVDTEGLDLTARYSFEALNGDVTAHLNYSFLFQEQQATATSPVVDRSGTIFNPAKTRGRIGATWSSNTLSVTGVINYMSAYDNNISVVQDDISSWTTLDTVVNFSPGWGGSGRDIEFSLAVENLLDERPPVVASDTFPFGVDVGFDSTNASAQGRLVSFEVKKRW